MVVGKASPREGNAAPMSVESGLVRDKDTEVSLLKLGTALCHANVSRALGKGDAATASGVGWV